MLNISRVLRWWRPHYLRIGAALALIGMSGAAVKADILAAATNQNLQQFPNALVPVDLTGGAGGTDVAFTVGGPTTVAISFDARCAVRGNGFMMWANIDILVDPAPPGGGFIAGAPTAGQTDAFCTTNGTGGFDGWVNPSRTVVTSVPAGVSTVRVQAQTLNGNGPTELGFTSLVVHD